MQMSGEDRCGSASGRPHRERDPGADPV